MREDEIACKAMGINARNVKLSAFAIGAMLVLVTGAAVFELPLPLAVLGHEGGTVLVVLNGLRLLSDPIRNPHRRGARSGG